MMSQSRGAAFAPSRVSLCILWKSRINLRRAGVLISAAAASLRTCSTTACGCASGCRGWSRKGDVTKSSGWP